MLAACANQTSPIARHIAVDTTPGIDIYDHDATIDPVFEYPSGGMRFSNGSLAINDYYAAKVLYFDSSGKLLRSLGGHGRGPDEYGGATTWVGACARDSAFVFIADKMKVIVLDSAGNTARTFAPNAEHGTGLCDYDGRAVFLRARMTRMPKRGDPPMPVEIAVGSVNADNVASIGKTYQKEYGPGRPIPHAVMRLGKIYVGDGASGKIDVYTRTGSKARIDTGAQRRPMTRRIHEAALEDFVSYLVTRGDRERMKKFFDERFGMPDRTPAYRKFYVDTEGLVWVDVSQPGEMSTFRIISGDDGSLISTVRMPAELRVFEIGRDHVLAASEDKDGLPHVAVYAVRRN